MTQKGITGELLQSRGEVEFEWRIIDFMSLSAENGDNYKSPIFHFMDSLWYFNIFPNNAIDSDDWISVYLTRNDPGPARSVEYSIHIQSENLPAADVFGKKWTTCHTFQNQKDDWGWRQMFKRSELLKQKSSLLPSGILTLKCCFKKADTEAITVKSQPMKLTELDTLSEDLGNLLICGANCDVTLKVENKEFRAHSSILTARSDVFASMFKHEFSESNTGVVDIADCDPGSFGDFLRYLYTGKVEDATQDKVLHLFKTADKYSVLKLKSFCVEFMVCHLSADNVCAVATLAQLHEEEELFTSVQAFFNKNVAKILSTKSWEKLLREDYLLANKLLKEMASKIKIQD